MFWCLYWLLYANVDIAMPAREFSYYLPNIRFTFVMVQLHITYVVDYCVANGCCAPSFVRPGSSSTEGFAMKRRETTKYDKYKTNVRKNWCGYYAPRARWSRLRVSDTFLKFLKKMTSRPPWKMKKNEKCVLEDWLEASETGLTGSSHASVWA